MLKNAYRPLLASILGIITSFNLAQAENYYQEQRKAYLEEHPLFAELFQAEESERPGFVTAHKKKAETGDAKSALLYALALQSGIGIERDLEVADQWLKMAAEEGDVRAIYAYATSLMKKEAQTNRDLGALGWMRKAAEKDYAKAQAAVGARLVMLKEPASAEEGLSLLETAFKNGQIQAAIMLARCYSFGFGVERDWAKTLEWYRKAAELGHPSAQFILAQEYMNGHGLPKNLEIARSWAQKAADQGLKDATQLLEEIKAAGE